jgi:hypothetical protein
LDVLAVVDRKWLSVEILAGVDRNFNLHFYWLKYDGWSYMTTSAITNTCCNFHHYSYWLKYDVWSCI